MRPFFLAPALGAVLAGSLPAAAPHHPDDAALRAVQFVDANEGWAVGDDGVILHTIDGGRAWEPQASNTRASLRGLHFLNPYTGWAVGRDELPNGRGSSGVLLLTRDGGLTWRRVGAHLFPGLNAVRFFDDKAGVVAGDGSDQFPTGVFTTADGGRSWQPVPGPRCTSWLAADFTDAHTGALAGAWSRLAAWRQGTLGAADVDTLGGRSLHGLQLIGSRAAAVGQGGLVLLSTTTAGVRWGFADLGLPAEALAGADFYAVQCRGDHLWVAGRPGSVVLHSADQGRTWQPQPTGQPLPLHGLFFRDAHQGWAVGELGTVLATADGGQTWAVQRRGGQRAAVLFVHARPQGVPLDAVARLGGEDGYLAAVLRVTAADPAAAEFRRATDAPRLEVAVRQAGGAAAEALWQFPLPGHLADAGRLDLVRAWDRLHGDRAADQLLRQLVLALRVWQPEVVVTDAPDGTAEALLGEAVREAFARAADPNAFPEQITQLRLKPCSAAKLYAGCEPGKAGPVVLDQTAVQPRLRDTPRDFAAPAAGLLAGGPAELPARRTYRLLAGRSAGAADHRDLMQGVTLAPGGTARRTLPEVADLPPELEAALDRRRNWQALVESLDRPPGQGGGPGLADPGQLLARIGPSLAALPDDMAAQAAFATATRYVRLGQWPLAREAFLLMVDRHPAHPLAADAYRWLIRLGSSSEARRRQELGQFLMLTESAVRPAPTDKDRPAPPVRRGAENVHNRRLALLSDQAEARKWYQSSLALEPRLAGFGPLFAGEPDVQFCLQAARRSLGDFEAPKQWFARFLADQHGPAAGAANPWRDAAAAEVWLTNRGGPPPRPAVVCLATATRPFLDGVLDDDCWQGKKLVLRNAVGDTQAECPTEAWLSYDQDFLYLALRCQHPAGRHVPPVAVRPRDADLRPFDRVSLLLDLDRDYQTCFHLQVDQRGCVCEDCWGDRAWDPRWFVAVKGEATAWQAEVAIPLVELTGDHVTPGRVWACNLVRVLPGRGVQALSLPADAQPRPEGMGLLLFQQEPKADRRAQAAP